ncbi:GntR family transcriptional regulator [Streptomyces sp. NBC_01506]|uniref:GntR family transcriptional regulator n=1 Tax=Streptomyces sp. NBC_01506 TaxID=2903887 RepID=UPI003864E5C6
MSPTVPKWRRIADRLAAQISDGTYPPGSRLPHIQELVSGGEGSTATVHRAYQTLEAEGLVRSSRGHGTTVLGADDAARSAVTGAGRLARLTRTGQPYSPRETAENRHSGLRSCADDQVAALLGIDPYDEIVVRSRTFVRDGKPTILGLNFIHVRALEHLPELLDPNPTPRWRHDLYTERTGRTVTAEPERRSARLASANELSEFGIDVLPGIAVPVLVLRTMFRDDIGPLELWEDIYRPGMEQVDQH